MFSGCNSLTNIDLSNFNTQNVTNMSYMFYKCSSLTNINLSNLKIMQYIMENGKKVEIKDMEEEYKYGLMEVDMKVIGLKIKQI